MVSLSPLTLVDNKTCKNSHCSYLEKPKPRSMLRRHATRRLNVRNLPDDWCLRTGKIKREVVGVAFMHDFHTKTSSVKDVRPRVDHMSFRGLDRLIEVEAIQVKSHGRYTKSSEPNANNRESTKKEVETPTIVKARILEDESAKITMRCHNVVGLFLLSKLVSIVM